MLPLQRCILDTPAHWWKSDVLALISAQEEHPSRALLPLVKCLRKAEGRGESTVFAGIADVVMHLLNKHGVSESALTATLDYVVEEFDLTKPAIADLLIKLVQLGARVVAEDKSTSLLISLAKNEYYAKTLLKVAESVPSRSKLLFVANNGDSVLKIAEENVKEGLFDVSIVLKLRELAGSLPPSYSTRPT